MNYWVSVVQFVGYEICLQLVRHFSLGCAILMEACTSNTKVSGFSLGDELAEFGRVASFFEPIL